MQLPAFFGHRRSINLLPHDPFESSTPGIILEWALAFGKWAVIITQLVVMGAFLYRFVLDRQATDLRKAIDKDVAIIKSYDQVETEFTLAQKKVVFAQDVIKAQNTVVNIFSRIQASTPPGVWYDKLNVTPERASFTAYATSLGNFGQLLTNLQNDPTFTGVSVAKIQDGGAKDAQIQFDINLTYGAQKK